jgi:two-component system CheB/CheR fusion protein
VALGLPFLVGCALFFFSCTVAATLLFWVVASATIIEFGLYRDLHNGTVEARSDGKGAGSEFVVRLPLAAPPDAREVPSTAPSRPRRILIIEDNLDAASSLRIALEIEGHEVETSLDGPEGLEKLREFAPDVVLCDIGLPEMDGYQVAQAIRETPAARRAFLVALTGYARPEDQQRAKDAGFDAHLAEPPTIEQIQKLIAHVPEPDPFPETRPQSSAIGLLSSGSSHV